MQYVVLVGKKNHKRSCRANEERIYIHRKPLNQPLFIWMGNFGRSRSMRGGSLPCFVAVYTTLNTPADCRSKNAAKSSICSEGRTKYQGKHFGYFINVKPNDYQCHNYVRNCHKR